MSQYESNFGNSGEYGVERTPQSNVLGIVGFILAFCLGPIGLLISLIALAKRPRGFAIAGVLVGLITTGALVILGLGAWKLKDSIMAAANTQMQYTQIDAAISSYKAANNGALPADLASANIAGGVPNDFWGTAWQIEVADDGSSYTLVSASMDQQFGTSDDIRIPGGLNPNQVGDYLEHVIKQMAEDALNSSPGSSGNLGPANP